MNHNPIHKMSGSARFVFAALLTCVVGNASFAAADGTRYYVNDHLATTVGITDAAGEIAALEADAFGSPLAGGPNAGRFTGKPYDEDLGAYVFPFRNYRADEARWMSADPSGFPDGVNAFFYHPNPFTALDPLGLASKVTQSSFDATGSVGGLSFSNVNKSGVLTVGADISFSTGVVDFTLAAGHNSWGWIVQKVDFNYSYKNTANSAVTNWTTSYWEAWGVSILPSGVAIISDYGRDTFLTQDFSGTYSGTATISGTAYFVAAVSGLENNPDTWGANVPQANGLPSIYPANAPSWLPTGTGLTHTLSLQWRE